ncbi:hypothetical protein [Corynebacterium pseudopelargi]|uniref:Uncharacterized protein n=1 Tax=Corynebacterium pseudopelargi TaxID=2080757 RepID=A0A3G6J1M6_9CORY|nr:hypothetical protein [Corynebacterium pseudopelargi]AZA10280.1 hypothetical protein CPPEL_10945 [Corynebacterium pseudopelargi]
MSKMSIDPITLKFLIMMLPMYNPGFAYILHRPNDPRLSETERVRKALGDTLKVTLPGFVFSFIISYWVQPISTDWGDNIFFVCVAYLGVLVLALRWG